jgi:transmembrane sensor
VAAISAVAILLWLRQPGTQFQNIATAVAQRQVLTLADGSRIELNARTTVRVDFTRSARRIQLAEGEAFFTVTKDPARPFLVETPAGSVRVTGTTFVVRTAAISELQVTVVEGSVLVRPDAADGSAGATPRPLRAGNRLTTAAGVVSVQTLAADELEDILAWRQGIIVFDGVPLQVALARFAHHHGRGINVLAAAAAHRVSGRYSLDDLDGFIGMLDQAFPVEVTRTLSGTVTVAPRAER